MPRAENVDGVVDVLGGLTVGVHLVFSTRHIPNAEPDFGEVRTAAHDYGWLVFVWSQDGEVPAWLEPILAAARAAGCTLVLFDRDAAVVESFETWEW